MLREYNVVDPLGVGLRLGAKRSGIILGLLLAVADIARVTVAKVEVEVPGTDSAISSARVSVAPGQSGLWSENVNRFGLG